MVAAIDVDVGLTVEDDEAFAAHIAAAKHDTPRGDVASSRKSFYTTQFAGGTRCEQVNVVESVDLGGTVS